MPNRLAQSTSPYLLQHQHNPVDWREWSDEAFAEARERDVVFVLRSATPPATGATMSSSTDCGKRLLDVLPRPT